MRSIARTLALPVLALALATTTTTMTACKKKEDPAAQIRKVLDAGAAALEERDSNKAADTLSEDYLDKGGRDKKKLKGLAFFALQQGPVLVSMQNVEITVNGDHADVTMKVLAVQGSAELKKASDLLPTNARTFDLSLKMSKDDGEWRVSAINGLPSMGMGE